MPTAVRTRRQQDRKVTNKKQSTTAPATHQKAQQIATKSVTSLSHDQALMNLQQSNTIVKTMLDATFGCMTFLRGLLPEGNFDDVQIAAPDPGPESRPYRDDTLPLASQKSNYDESTSESQPKGGRGLRIKKIKRGYSTEADKLLDWIDIGIVEAVEKQYLKACVFAVYLDPEDPSNLVEALTINFHYPELADTGVRIPQFDIEDSIHNLHIGGSKGLGDSTDSARGPDGMKLRTIGEVKRAIKKLIKSLIITCQSLGELPSRRWVTMRLEYFDETPTEYEPPFFVAADANQKLHFDTRDKSQVPDKTSIGQLETGFHSLSLKLTSITEYIPRTLDIDEEQETYGGFGASGDKSYNLGKKRRADEAALRTDAGKRRVIWDALDVSWDESFFAVSFLTPCMVLNAQTIEDRADIDPAYQDADGEPDSQVPNQFPASPVTKPMGIRQADGTVVPYASPKAIAVPEKGISQDNVRSSQLDPTYVSGRRDAEGDDIQDDDWHMDAAQEKRKPADSQPGTLAKGPAEPNLSPSLDPVTSIVFPEAIPNQQDSDTEMMDTSSKDGDRTSGVEESIGSFDGAHETRRRKPSNKKATIPYNVSDRPRRTPAANRGNGQKQQSYQMCPCVAPKEDETMVECEGCTTWYHMPCAGYLNEDDLPEKYICIICRMVSAGHFSDNKMSEARSYLPSLTLERRALKKMYNKMKFESIYNMQQEIGCDSNDIHNLLERFQELGFLKKETYQVFRKINKTTSRNVSITIFHAQDDPKTRKRFTEYFEPGGLVELKAFGITSAMLEKGYTAEKAKAKRAENKSVAVPVEKENVVPIERKNTRAQIAKTIALPKPSRPVNLPLIAKSVVAPVIHDGGQPRTEIVRPTIPLPKSKPKQPTVNQSGGQNPNVGKGLFRTAASITVPPVTTEDVLTPVHAAQAQTNKAQNQAGFNKASVPEEDVDMGV